MGNDNDGNDPKDLTIPSHFSMLRALTAAGEGTVYEAFDTLAAARAHPHVAMIMEADSGGQILVTCPVAKVHADEAVLNQLLCDLESITWGVGGLSDDDVPTDAELHYEPLPPGSGVSGGMGGGIVIDGIWIHRELEDLGLRQQIEEILTGTRRRLDLNTTP